MGLSRAFSWADTNKAKQTSPTSIWGQQGKKILFLRTPKSGHGGNLSARFIEDREIPLLYSGGTDHDLFLGAGEKNTLFLPAGREKDLL